MIDRGRLGAQYRDGGAVPRRTEIKGQDHMLAYITPAEAKVLKARGGAGKPGPGGIPSYYARDADMSVGRSSGGGSKSKGGSESKQSGGGQKSGSSAASRGEGPSSSSNDRSKSEDKQSRGGGGQPGGIGGRGDGDGGNRNVASAATRGSGTAASVAPSARMAASASLAPSPGTLTPEALATQKRNQRALGAAAGLALAGPVGGVLGYMAGPSLAGPMGKAKDYLADGIGSFFSGGGGEGSSFAAPMSGGGGEGEGGFRLFNTTVFPESTIGTILEQEGQPTNAYESLIPGFQEAYKTDYKTQAELRPLLEEYLKDQEIPEDQWETYIPGIFKSMGVPEAFVAPLPTYGGSAPDSTVADPIDSFYPPGMPGGQPAQPSLRDTYRYPFISPEPMPVFDFMPAPPPQPGQTQPVGGFDFMPAPPPQPGQRQPVGGFDFMPPPLTALIRKPSAARARELVEQGRVAEAMEMLKATVGMEDTSLRAADARNYFENTGDQAGAEQILRRVVGLPIYDTGEAQPRESLKRPDKPVPSAPPDVFVPPTTYDPIIDSPYVAPRDDSFTMLPDNSGSFRRADLPGFDPTITGARAAPNYGITPSGATAYSPYGAMLPYEFPAISPNVLGMSQPVYSSFNYGPYGLPASSGTTAFDYLNGTAGPRPFSSYNARPFG